MARYRQTMEKLNQTSTAPTELLKIHVKKGEWEFKAEGNAKTVTHLFEKFQKLVNSTKAAPPHQQTSHSVPPKNFAFHSSKKKEQKYQYS